MGFGSSVADLFGENHLSVCRSGFRLNAVLMPNIYANDNFRRRAVNSEKLVLRLCCQQVQGGACILRSLNTLRPQWRTVRQLLKNIVVTVHRTPAPFSAHASGFVP